MKETEKIMKQVDKEERRRSKQQAAAAPYPLYSRASKASSAATTPTLPRYPSLSSFIFTWRQSLALWPIAWTHRLLLLMTPIPVALSPTYGSCISKMRF